MNKIRTSISLTVLSIFLFACTPQKTAEEYINVAQIHINNNEYNESIIQLKNAIKSEPENVPARTLLGETYLKLNQGANAEKELSRVIRTGAVNEHNLTLFLESLYIQNKYQDIIDTATKYEKEMNTESLLYKTIAYINIDDKDNAHATIDDAKELSETSLHYLLSKAFVDANDSNNDQALELLNEISNKSDDIALVYWLKGQILSTNGDLDGALIAYEKYYKMEPNDHRIRVVLALNHIRNKQFSEAKGHLSFLLEKFPEHSYSNQLMGIVSFNDEDFESSLNFTVKAIQAGLNTDANKALAGISAYHLERYEASYEYLVGISELNSNHTAKKILAIVQLELGYISEANESLLKFDNFTEDDLSLVSEASMELINIGEIDQARALLKNVKSENLSNQDDLIRLGELKLSLEDVEGIVDIQRAYENNPSSAAIKYSLSMAYQESGDFNKAIDIADEWIQLEPELVDGHNLAARLYLLNEERDKAEVHLESALKINDGNVLSLVYFAEKHIENKSLAEANRLVEKLLSVQPNNIAGLITYYRVQKLTGSAERAVESVELAFKKNKNNLFYVNLYGNILYLEKRYKDVINLISAVNLGGSPRSKQVDSLWGLQLNSYDRISDRQNLYLTLEKWAVTSNYHVPSVFTSLMFFEKTQDYSMAVSLLSKAIKKHQNNHIYKVLQTQYTLLAGDVVGARELSKSIKRDVIPSGLMHGIDGQLLLANEDYTEAVPKLKDYYDYKKNTLTVRLLTAAYRKSGQLEAAIDLLINFLELKPHDSKSRFLLADIYLLEGDSESANKEYKILVDKGERNAVILNNYASTLADTGNLDEGLVVIDEAMTLLPENVYIIDTKAKILELRGDTSKALSLRKKCYLLSEKAPKFAIKYIEALVLAGDRVVAQEVLKETNPVDKEQEKKLNDLKNKLQEQNQA